MPLTWTAEEDAILIASYRNGDKPYLMTALHGRTWKAIRGRAHKINASGTSHAGKNRYELLGEIAVLSLDRRDGSTLGCMIDADQLERVLAVGKWRAIPRTGRPGLYYVRCGSILMHRFILGCGPDEEGDHLHGDGLDNRNSNLRIVTHAQNAQNLTRQTTATYGRNVGFNKSLGYFVSRVKVAGKTTVKYSRTLEEAVRKAAELKSLLHPFHVVDRD